MTDNTDSVPDGPSDHCFVAGRTGVGKTTRLARYFTDKTEPHEWIDPKDTVNEGEDGAQ